jgi:hypothetical protein
MAERMRTFSFDGNTLEQMHGWMQQGQGIDGIQPAIDALSGLSRDLDNSMDSLRRALTAIGAWAGPAGDSADGATRQGEEWVLVSTPQVTDSASNTDGVASGFVSTQSRMPSPAEAELTNGERSVASAVPIIGPILDRQLADDKRDRVTNEARQRMRDWQDGAQDSVNGVQPLPPVPLPAVEVAPPRTQGTPVPAGPDLTGLAGASPAAPPAPPSPAAPPLVPGSSTPPLGPVVPPGSQQQPPVRPPLLVTPPAPPTPVGPPPVAPGRPIVPGVPVMPLPLGNPGAGDTAGRRRAYGPGAFNSEEIARARGGAGAAARGGVLGAVPVDDGAQGRAAGVRGEAGAGAGAQGRGAAAAGRAGAGSIMQPAVGGARGEDDQEHTDKYAVESDEYFVGEPHKVAPPVIGGS